MMMRRCKNGHYYEPEKYTTCPYCGVDIDLRDTITPARPTVPDAGKQAKMPANDAEDLTRRAPSPQAEKGHLGQPAALPEGSQSDDEETIRVLPGADPEGKGPFDPVVGWLVCIQGPNRGESYLIRSGRSSIGRDEANTIMIPGDQTMSRNEHAFLIYDPRANVFKIAPGNGTGLVYLNSVSVDVPTLLHAHDVIELGQTQLLFVPLCGDDFRWDAV